MNNIDIEEKSLIRDEKPGSFIALFLSLLVLFPEVGFYPSTDIQPNFFVVAILCILALPHRLSISRNAIFYFLFCFLMLWIHFAVHQENIVGIYIIKYCVSLVTIFLCYLLCLNQILIINNRLIIFAASVYFIVGMIQLLFIPDFLSFLVATADTGYAMIISGRGMPSLSAEPSHVGGIISLLNILYVFNSLTRENKKESYRSLYFVSFSLFFLNCLISQSLYACFYHFVCVIGISFILNRRFTYLLLIIGFFSFVSIVASL